MKDDLKIFLKEVNDDLNRSQKSKDRIKRMLLLHQEMEQLNNELKDSLDKREKNLKK